MTSKSRLSQNSSQSWNRGSRRLQSPNNFHVKARSKPGQSQSQRL